jgi:hypothetical protein
MRATTDAPPVPREPVAIQPADTLLDNVLPAFEFRGRTVTRVHATPEQIFRAVREVTPAEMPAARFLGELRYLPGRVLGRAPRAEAAAPFLDSLLHAGNLELAETPDRELVIGLVGKLHNLFDQQFVHLGDAEVFATFNHPEYEKCAQSFRIAGGDAATEYMLVAEHRTHALSRSARRKFAAYWVVIDPASRVLLDMLLGAVGRRAERTALQTHGVLPDRPLGGYARASSRSTRAGTGRDPAEKGAEPWQ